MWNFALLSTAKLSYRHKQLSRGIFQLKFLLSLQQIYSIKLFTLSKLIKSDCWVEISQHIIIRSHNLIKILPWKYFSPFATSTVIAFLPDKTLFLQFLQIKVTYTQPWGDVRKEREAYKAHSTLNILAYYF
jgi:hypothetical protein